jgi:hypothetical protein
MFSVFFALPVIIPLPSVKGHLAKSAKLGRINIVRQHDLITMGLIMTQQLEQPLQRREIPTTHFVRPSLV